MTGFNEPSAETVSMQHETRHMAIVFFSEGFRQCEPAIVERVLNTIDVDAKKLVRFMLDPLRRALSVGTVAELERAGPHRADAVRIDRGDPAFAEPLSYSADQVHRVYSTGKIRSPRKRQVRIRGLSARLNAPDKRQLAELGANRVLPL